MRNSLLTGAAAVLFLGAGVFGVLAFRASARQGQVYALTVPDAQLDIGEVPQQCGFEWALSIENRGSESVVIERFERSCGCASVAPRALTIAAGESRDVRLTLDLLPRAETPLEEFSLHVAPVLGTDDGPIPFAGWSLRGRVRNAITPSTLSVVWGGAEALVEGRTGVGKSVTVTCQEPLEALLALCPPHCAATRVHRSGEAFRVEVVPNESLPIGPFEFSLDLVAISLLPAPAATPTRCVSRWSPM